MNFRKASIAVIFLTASSTAFYAQDTRQDTIKKEKKIEGVVIQGSSNKKTETAVLGEQKKAIIQKQAVSAEEISRKGISNVEQGLTKVTGITTVEGRGLFVRGLEERYNYLLINGLGSPSNNPFQKIIALKQFPTDVVGKLNIYKTFNSNLYGDFAGATFDIETLTIDKPFSKIEFSVGVNTLSTFRDNFKVAEGADGMNGYLGLNSRDRRLPNEVRDYRPNTHNFTKDESLNSFKDSWNVNNIKTLPNTSIGFTTVQKVKTGETGNIGILFSLNQGSKYSYKEGDNNQFRDNGQIIEVSNLLNKKSYIYELESSALLGAAYKNRGTNINLNAIYLQNSANIIEDFKGYKNFSVEDNRFFRTNQQDISKFLNLQLTASQKIGERHLFKAGGSYVLNNYSQPDRKIFELTYPQDFSHAAFSYGGNNLIRQYLDVDGKFYASAFGEYSVFLGEKGDKKEFPMQLSVGYNGFSDIRKNSYRFIFGTPKGTNTPVFIDIDSPQSTLENSIKNDKLFYKEDSDAYSYLSNIYQFVNAGYLNFDYKPTESWDILIGGRFENDMRIIRYNKPGVSDRINLTTNKNYFLPSLSIKKALDSKNNLRLSLSKTVTRPILIETMPIEYINPDNTTVRGNENIKNSENYNIDLKWEYFPSNKEMFAVNLFAKRIDNAIEKSIAPSGNASGVVITYYNSKKATLAGIELEGILSLGRISDALDKFTFGANATFMYSDVKRSEEQLKTERPNIVGFTDDQLHKRGLQGAAPYTINADLKYEYKNSKNLSSTLSLVYNVSGSKIYAVGGSGTDNYYEKPFNQLDFVYQNQIDKNWNIKFRVQNILNSKYRVELGDDNYYTLRTNDNYSLNNYFNGVNFNFTVGYTF
ncbi:outer membrane beta-barrel protein [Chryseobacterium sp. PTM-20240506]|uniref:outer membrane beta-barrel protein n=1 Tax=unclassified Chryseobacterium TaxID=2593645 RepID=UPI0023599A16|nr:MULTISPECIES: outer membrane beta-barrel protein [unclassified Chryseobacterium]MDC8104889.1 TonB-dependent receptor [Chryseobacterium sp. B21-037]MDQ1805220.1 TonB-dependent receptor [Chryseobacterium sp. CKR4-1]